MRLHSTVFVCAASALLLAGRDAKADPLQDAIKRATPSPFISKTANPADVSVALSFDPGKINLYPTTSSLPQILTRELTIEKNRECAIPLLKAPVEKGKNFTVRKYEIPKTLFDDMAKAPPAPACPSSK